MSARMDGEAGSTEVDRLDLHLDSCVTCQAWEARVHDLRRTVAMRQALPPVDLADQVTTRLSVPQMGVGQWVRYALGVVAASLVVLNVPLLAGLADGDHQSRHLGTFGVALGIGLLWAAWQPERAIGLVPLATALSVTTLAAALIDLGSGRTAAVAEASHALELVGLGLLLALSGGPQRFLHRRRPPDLAGRAGTA